VLKKEEVISQKGRKVLRKNSHGEGPELFSNGEKKEQAPPKKGFPSAFFKKRVLCAKKGGLWGGKHCLEKPGGDGGYRH